MFIQYRTKCDICCQVSLSKLCQQSRVILKFRTYGVEFCPTSASKLPNVILLHASSNRLSFAHGLGRYSASSVNAPKCHSTQCVKTSSASAHGAHRCLPSALQQTYTSLLHASRTLQSPFMALEVIGHQRRHSRVSLHYMCRVTS